jgi:hypothetical protein
MANDSSTLKELTTGEMVRIIYTTWRELYLVADPVTPWEPFNELDPALYALETAQVEALIANVRTRPNELHQIFKVTGQKMISDLVVNENIIARLKPYMIPFERLPAIDKTKFRLQVQLTRTLMRHNRNVKRYQKRQRQRQTLSGSGVAEG